MPKQGETPKLYIHIITYFGLFVKGASINLKNESNIKIHAETSQNPAF